MKKIILIFCFTQCAFGAAAPEQGLQEQFVKEIVAGDLEAVKKSVAAGANLDELDRKKCSPLARAIIHNHVQIAQFLISQGADKTFVHENGNNLMHFAALNDATESIKFLASIGFDLNAENKSKNYCTPLELAISVHKNNAATTLIQSGANCDKNNRFGCPPILYAISNRNYTMYEELLDRGADINFVHELGNNLLHIAALNGATYVVIDLLNKGLNIESLGNNKLSPLAQAATHNRISTMKYLLKQGANINFKHETGNNLLHLAIFNKAFDAIGFLIDKGFDVDALGHLNSRPLTSAINTDFPKVIDHLIAHKADVNFITPCGNDLVNYAVKNQKNQALRALLNNGVNPDKKEADGKTPLHNAQNDKEQVRILLDALADYRIADGDGHTPDFYAEPDVAHLYTNEQARRQNEKEVLIKSRDELLDHNLPAEVIDIVHDYMLAKPIRKKALI